MFSAINAAAGETWSQAANPAFVAMVMLWPPQRKASLETWLYGMAAGFVFN